ncbi:MAG TPA: UDP-N-acetylmuramate dehydrogenase [Bryobacteraceae bacterium]|nr:UDP-N-acetylmuramate dehydrogenase [Bryobacteraceae bacterium]
MPVRPETIERLADLPNVAIFPGALLSEHTRFAIGGPADLYFETADEHSFVQALQLARQAGATHTIIGEGSNLIVSDGGFAGLVLRFTGRALQINGATVRAEAGLTLQTLVDHCVAAGLRGLETMTGIPGCLGAAVYGNAGAYGHSIDERVTSVRFFDGAGVRSFNASECEFRYRESVFKRHKEWIILAVELAMQPADPAELRKTADEIFQIRLAKYPLDMKCAGSIFKNLLLADLSDSVRGHVPDRVVREGKVPSAYFLEQVGAKGMQNGGIRVADYHANLIYNTGGGTARQLREIIACLKSRVLDRFGLELEEEVQYVGF